MIMKSPRYLQHCQPPDRRTEHSPGGPRSCYLRRPLAAAEFQQPGATAIDRHLILGALIFGVGWGVVGHCPGPAVAALAFGASGTILFVLAMRAGMLLQGFVAGRAQ